VLQQRRCRAANKILLLRVRELVPREQPHARPPAVSVYELRVGKDAAQKRIFVQCPRQPLQLHRQPSIILIAQRDKLTGGHPDRLIEVPRRTHAHRVLHYPDRKRCKALKFLYNCDRLVG
jgi:hypothetical protein